MRLLQSLFWLVALATTIQALALPTAFDDFTTASRELFKRKGGGGGKGGGSSGSSGSKGGSSSSSSSSSSSGSKGGSSSGRTSSSSNTGGSTSKGSGTTPSYAGAYSGGARVPYTAGGRSSSGVTPYFLGAGALAFFPGIWLYGAYGYPYYHSVVYHNTTSNRNETMNATCYCARFSECGCDNNTDSAYLNSVANNASAAKVATVNGTQQLAINGTLDNGTTASGGSDSAAMGMKQQLLELSGWWVVVAGVAYTVWLA